MQVGPRLEFIPALGQQAISNFYVGHKRTEDSDVYEVGGLYKTRPGK